MPITLNGSGAVTGLSQLPDSAMAAGAILQVVQSVKTDTQTGTTSGTNYVDVLTQAITPSSASNKILINVSLACDIETNHYGMVAQLFRDSTAIMK